MADVRRNGAREKAAIKLLLPRDVEIEVTGVIDNLVAL